MDEEKPTFKLEDFDQIVLACAADEECMSAYLEARGATPSEIKEILRQRKIREDRDA